MASKHTEKHGSEVASAATAFPFKRVKSSSSSSGSASAFRPISSENASVDDVLFSRISRPRTRPLRRLEEPEVVAPDRVVSPPTLGRSSAPGGARRRGSFWRSRNKPVSLVTSHCLRKAINFESESDLAWIDDALRYVDEEEDPATRETREKMRALVADFQSDACCYYSYPDIMLDSALVATLQSSSSGSPVARSGSPIYGGSSTPSATQTATQETYLSPYHHTARRIDLARPSLSRVSSPMSTIDQKNDVVSSQRFRFGESFVNLFEGLTKKKKGSFYVVKPDSVGSSSFVCMFFYDEREVDANRALKAVLTKSKKNTRKRLTDLGVEFDVPLNESLRKREATKAVELQDRVDLQRVNSLSGPSTGRGFGESELATLTFSGRFNTSGLFTLLLNDSVKREGNHTLPRLLSSSPFVNSTYKRLKCTGAVNGLRKDASSSRRVCTLGFHGWILPEKSSRIVAQIRELSKLYAALNEEEFVPPKELVAYHEDSKSIARLPSAFLAPLQSE